MAGVAREKLLVKLEDKILAKQEAQLDRIMTGLSIVALAGFLLLFTPLFLMRRYPGRLGVLVKYSVLASVTFVVAVNLFAGVLLVMRTVQGAAGRATNPQLAIVHATFDTIDEKAEDLAIAGPTLIEPTLAELSGGETDEPMPALLLANVQKFKKDFTVFSDLAAFFKQVSVVFGYLPIVLTLVTLILFCLAARPTLEQIVTLPARAAAGEAGVGKQVLKDTFRRIGRELVATLGVIGVLLGLTLLGGLVLSQALKPAMEAFLAYLFASFIYVQVAENASSTWVMIGLGGTLVFVILNLVTILVATSFYLGKAQQIFQQRVHDKVPLGRHRRFWTLGTIAVAWVIAFPWLYILGAKPLVEVIIDATGGGEMPNWPLLLTSGPLVLVFLFAFVFWAARGWKALLFVKGYDPTVTPLRRLLPPEVLEDDDAALPLQGATLTGQ